MSGVPASDSLMRELIREVLRELVREEVQRVVAELGPRASSAASSITSSTTSGRPTRIERGPLTERLVEQSRAAGEIRVARGVAITPLAKDRARALGVQIVREP